MTPDAADAAFVATVTHPNQLPADANCLKRGDLSRWNRRGFTIDCGCTRPWGKGNQVSTPCCSAHQRNIRHGELLACRECNWWYRIYLFPEGGTTRWISIGPGR